MKNRRRKFKFFKNRGYLLISVLLLLDSNLSIKDVEIYIDTSPAEQHPHQQLELYKEQDHEKVIE